MRGNQYFLHWLLFGFVHWSGVVGYCREVDFVEVDVADGVVVRRLEVNDFTGQVDDGCPMRGAGNVGRFAERVLNTDGDVKVVEDVETLFDCRDSICAFWGSGAIKRSSDEA